MNREDVLVIVLFKVEKKAKRNLKLLAAEQRISLI